MDQDAEILEDRSVSMEAIGLYVCVLAGPLILLQAGVFIATWGWKDLRTGLDALLTLRTGVPAFIGGVLLHEALHGIGWKFAGAIPWRAVRFGFQAATLTPYAHARVPLQARAYRIGVVLPLLGLGVVPYGLGLASTDGRLAMFGMALTLVAGGDMAIIWLLRGVPSSAWVQDHPTRAGCQIVARGA